MISMLTRLMRAGIYDDAAKRAEIHRSRRSADGDGVAGRVGALRRFAPRGSDGLFLA